MVLRSTWCPMRRGTVCVPCFEGTLLLCMVLTRPTKSGQFSNVIIIIITVVLIKRGIQAFLHAVIDSGSSSTAVLQQIKEIFWFYQFQSLKSNSTKIGYRFSLRSWEERVEIKTVQSSRKFVTELLLCWLLAGILWLPKKQTLYRPTWQWWWTSIHAKKEKIKNWFLHRLPCFHNWIMQSLCINLAWKLFKPDTASHGWEPGVGCNGPTAIRLVDSWSFTYTSYSKQDCRHRQHRNRSISRASSPPFLNSLLLIV